MEEKKPPSGFIKLKPLLTTTKGGGFFISKKTRMALCLGLLGLLLFGGSYSRGRFFIHAGEFRPGDLELVLETLQQTEELFAGIYNYLPAENLDLIIFSSVTEMQSAFGVGPWVGAYYTDHKTYLQPLETLKKREVLRKVLFIEYAHYYFDSYTNGTCPAWFNELCSYYLFRLVSGEPVLPAAPACVYAFSRYSDFIDLDKNIRDHDRLEVFYYYSLRFAFFLQVQYNVNPCLPLLKAMHGGVSLERALEQATGKTPAVLFEEEFLTWLARK